MERSSRVILLFSGQYMKKKGHFLEEVSRVEVNVMENPS